MLVILGISSTSGGGAEKQFLLHYKILAEFHETLLITDEQHQLYSRLYTIPRSSLYSPYFFIKRLHPSTVKSKTLVLVSYNLAYDIHFALLRLFFALFSGLKVRHIVFERSSPRHQGVTLLKRYLRLLSIQSCSKILTNSQHAQSYYISKYPKKDIGYVPNILDLPASHLLSDQPAHRPPSNLSFFSASRLIPSKGHIQTVSFLEKIALLRPDLSISLSIYGTGPLQSRLTSYKPRYLSKYTVSPWSDLNLKTLPKDSVFISLSAYEGCPNSVIEALAHGFRVVLSSIPGHTEINSSNISFVGPTDHLCTSTICTVLSELSTPASPEAAILISDFYSLKRIKPLLLNLVCDV